MRSHYRNLHDCSHWANTFEKTLLEEAKHHPDKTAHVEHILSATKKEILDRFRKKEAKAKIQIKLNTHVKETREMWNNKNKNK